jgi:hypothetical protein
VKYIISGHDHYRSINEFGKSTYITLDALLDGFPEASFLKLKVTANKADYEFQALK